MFFSSSSVRGLSYRAGTKHTTHKNIHKPKHNTSNNKTENTQKHCFCICMFFVCFFCLLCVCVFYVLCILFACCFLVCFFCEEIVCLIWFFFFIRVWPYIRGRSPTKDIIENYTKFPQKRLRNCYRCRGKSGAGGGTGGPTLLTGGEG